MVHTIKLNNGVEMPEIGLGTWAAHKTGIVSDTLKTAVDLGYRHIDCATIYGNQVEIGEALKHASVPRKELFIVSKIWQTMHRPELVPKALDEILEQLQLDYLDLLLVHWPYALKPETPGMKFTASDLDNVPIMDTWRAMEALVDTGKVRAIGVSNFNQSILEKMIPQCRIIPAVNQIELNPYNQQTRLVKFCKHHNIALTAYCPLGGANNSIIEDTYFKRIAEAHMCTPAQAVLSWNLMRGVAVIPKSTNPLRLKLNIHRITPTSDEMRLSAKLDKQERTCDPASDIKELEWVFHEDIAACPLI